MQFNIFQWNKVLDARILKEEYCIKQDGTIFEIIDSNIVDARGKFRIELRELNECGQMNIIQTFERSQNIYDLAP